MSDEHVFSRQSYLLDLSMVPSLNTINQDQPPGTFIVPKTLDQLLRTTPSPELAALLTSAAMPDDPGPREREDSTINVNRLTEILETYRNLVERGVITVIPDESLADVKFEGMLDSVGDGVAEAPAFKLLDGSSMTPRNLVRRHLTTILNHSVRTGTAILAHGRSLVSRIRTKLTVLEARVDKLLEPKEAFKRRIFKDHRARTVIVGVAIAGLALALPHVGVVAGVVFACVDP